MKESAPRKEASILLHTRTHTPDTRPCPLQAHILTIRGHLKISPVIHEPRETQPLSHKQASSSISPSSLQGLFNAPHFNLQASDCAPPLEILQACSLLLGIKPTLPSLVSDLQPQPAFPGMPAGPPNEAPARPRQLAGLCRPPEPPLCLTVPGHSEKVPTPAGGLPGSNQDTATTHWEPPIPRPPPLWHTCPVSGALTLLNDSTLCLPTLYPRGHSPTTCQKVSSFPGGHLQVYNTEQSSV